MKKTKRIETPVRIRAARTDASLGTITESIESDYGLPSGSVMLILPSGRKARVDSKVRSLRRSWS